MTIFEKMLAKWPSAAVAQTEIGRFSGGVLHSETMSNLCSRGEGPEGRYRVGRKVFYDAELLVKWLQDRMVEGGDDD